MRTKARGVLLALFLAGCSGGAGPGADPAKDVAASGAYKAEGAVVPAPGPGGQALPATLLKPDGAGPFPAVVILHDCSGLGRRSSGAPGRWGSLLAGEGYVVLIPDSFTPRGFYDGVCEIPGSQQRAVGPYQRAVDAYASLVYLRTLSFVDGQRVAVMGGSHGGSSTLASMVVPPQPGLAAERRDGFAAGIALYPGCGANYGAWSVTRANGQTGAVTAFRGTYQPLAPLLILIGGSDDWTPAEHCRVLAERAAAAGYAVSIKIYPGAYHAFDSPNPRAYNPNRNNPNAPGGRGATTGGDREAWADAIEQVNGFLTAHLK